MRLWCGMRAIGVSQADSWRVISQTALDSMPLLRRKVLSVLAAKPQPIDTHIIASDLEFPSQTGVRRTLEDLYCHGVVSRLETKCILADKAHKWELSSWTRDKIREAQIKL